MARTRRILTRGGSEFDPFSGEGWEDETALDLSLVRFEVVDLPFTLDFGAAPVTQITIWEDGFVSFGPATQAQIDWVAVNPPPASLFDFPGEYIAAGYRDVVSEFQDVRYAAGLIDFDADPETDPPYSIDDAVDIFRISWSTSNFTPFQLQLTANDFAIVDVSVSNLEEDPGQIGFRIDGYSFDAVEQPMAEFFVNHSLGGVYFGDRFADILGGTFRGDTLIGMAGNDRLFGDDGNDRLNGGRGADRMHGGNGNDTYVVNRHDDLLFEEDGGGIDTVLSVVSFTLAAQFERLTLTGTTAINGIGNGLDNILIGNNAANKLVGGAGADRMRAGGGNDVYIVDNIRDKVEEAATGGMDRVYSSISETLAANVERLILTGFSSIDARGNDLANNLVGNNAANRLSGRGGNDNLRGEGGADRFVFNTVPDSVTNKDRIVDFATEDDFILLDVEVFSAISAGTLAAAAFHSGTAAHDSTDRIIHDPATGDIFYDADGTGAAVAVLFATVDPGLTLSRFDFAGFGG